MDVRVLYYKEAYRSGFLISWSRTDASLFEECIRVRVVLGGAWAKLPHATEKSE